MLLRSWSEVMLIMSLGSFCLPLLAACSCPSQCVCASDILSCSGLGLEELPSTLPTTATVLDFNHNQLSRLEEGDFADLPRLDSLHLAHNHLSRLPRGAFQNGSRLRHLDLSSNLLHSVEPHYFQELLGLEELLLFNNRITQVESRALAGLSNLRKVYLSHNLLTDFPFFSIQEQSHPLLSMLDLSSNRMPKLPIEDIWNLPDTVQSGLFLHNNTLICDCTMYGLFVRWEQRGLPPVHHEYATQHTCLLYGERKAMVRFFQHRRIFENCTLHWQQRLLGQRDNSLLVNVGESITIECQTSLRGEHIRYTWVFKGEPIFPPGNNASLRMHSNGSLELVSVQQRDSGIYVCMALDRLRNETVEVNVTVVDKHDDDEHFNTGWTTLLGCVLTLVLVLTYLYMPPCHCPCRKQPPPVNPANESGTQPSILSPMTPGGANTEEPARKGSSNKHVVFMEPVKEVQNGRLHTKPQMLHYDNEAIYLDALIMQ
ncbi:amphoterin-induced protein 3 [Engraulis encrasicolus]|uniref:amphoterin-induced protein 3 n=1 Tax=Engraulis encrasicolus TaxID=184585 RepID=UPI002FCF2F18